MSGLNTSLYVRPLDNWHPEATPLKLVTRLQVVCDPTNTLHNHTVCTSARNALFIKLLYKLSSFRTNCSSFGLTTLPRKLVTKLRAA